MASQKTLGGQVITVTEASSAKLPGGGTYYTVFGTCFTNPASFWLSR